MKVTTLTDKHSQLRYNLFSLASLLDEAPDPQAPIIITPGSKSPVYSPKLRSSRNDLLSVPPSMPHTRARASMHGIQREYVPPTLRRRNNQCQDRRKEYLFRTPKAVGLGIILTSTTGNDGDDEEDLVSNSVVPHIIIDAAAIVENPAAFSLNGSGPQTYLKPVKERISTPHPENPSHMGRHTL
eukprot:GHVO01002917.1.p1 GENE.GHVO01002917.1~~GHVO01002917.1.p1  ORF type:complete len:193 (-),score=11.34 GHVO01002917.1:60-611(-)